MRIQCRIKGTGTDPLLTAVQGKNLLQLAKSQGSKCEVQLPSGVSVQVKGKNGQITLENLDSEAQAYLVNGKIEVARAGATVKATLENGRIEVDPDPARGYRYQTKVDLGVSPSWTDSKAPDAILLDLNVKRGSISRQDDSAEDGE